MRGLFAKTWFRLLLAALISGGVVLWLSLNGGIRYGGFGWFR
jgi:hypothetical protein